MIHKNQQESNMIHIKHQTFSTRLDVFFYPISNPRASARLRTRPRAPSAGSSGSSGSAQALLRARAAGRAALRAAPGSGTGGHGASGASDAAWNIWGQGPVAKNHVTSAWLSWQKPGLKEYGSQITWDHPDFLGG